MKLGLSCLMVLALAGCEPRASDEPREFTVRDSSGVRIVEYAAPPTGTRAFTFSAEPVYRQGDGPGEREFEFVYIGKLQPDGGAYVLDGGMGPQQVLQLAPDGTVSSTLSGPGQGPSEVRQVTSMHVVGPGIVLIEDGGNGKVMLFENGALAGSIRTADIPGLRGGLRAIGVDSGRRLLMITSSYMPNFTEEWLQGRMVRFDLADGSLDTVAAFDMAHSRPAGGTMNPFGPFGAAASSGDDFIQARSDRPELIWRAGTGEVKQILRWNPTRVLPTEEHMKMLENRLRVDLPRVNPGASKAEVDQLIERSLARYQLDPSEPLPLFSPAFESDGQGNLWIPDFSIAGALEPIPRYSIVAADGEWLGTVTPPAGFRVLDVAGDKVLGVLKDSMDVQSVAVFTVTSGPVQRNTP